jgi:mannosyltransferase
VDLTEATTSGTAADPSPLDAGPETAERPTRWPAYAVAGVLALGVVVRFVTVSHLWLDEAQTVAIASQPLGDIPEALRHDGAPPLFYVLLHGWMKLFGTGELAVRFLPGVFSVVSLPLAWLAARRLGGTRVAWAAVVLLASSPFATRYATEGRMYSLVVMLVLLGYLAVQELLARPSSIRAAVGVALVTGLLLLTHYWSIYLLFVVGVVLVVLARRGPAARRDGARRGVLAMALGSLAFLPWVPVFLYQLRHTGTPWGRPGHLRTTFDTLTGFAGGDRKSVV